MGRIKWWQFYRRGVDLYSTISQLDQVMAINRNTKYLLPDFQPSQNIVFTDSIVVFAFDSYRDFAILSSSIHEVWAWKNSSTKGSATLRYSGGSAFETFPIPIESYNADILELGQALINIRKSIMAKYQIGLTNLYNLVHSQKLQDDLNNSLNQIRKIQIELDVNVLNLYRWNDISLRHDFYELEHLPENDRIRFTIHPVARKEILKRLLQLNHDLYKKSELNKVSSNKPIQNRSIADLFNEQN